MTAAEIAAASQIAASSIPATVGGAVAGAVGGVPAAVQQKSLLPLLFGAVLGGAGGYLFGGQQNLSGALRSAAADVAKKAIINQLFGTQEGRLGITFEGMSDNGLFGSIAGFPGSMSRNFAYSARKGMEFVPYDNFLINAHYGEELETKEEANRSRRGENGRSVVINFNIGGNIIGDKQAFNDFAEKIDFVINKRNKRVYAAA